MKGRLFLIHWNDVEAAAMAEDLRTAGWEVAVEAQDGARVLPRIRSAPPRAVLISLTRLPSHGREIARALRSSAPGRQLRMIFLGGKAAAVEATRLAFPDADFIAADHLQPLLQDLAGLPQAE
jgi:CheY-like chemotaxis protein